MATYGYARVSTLAQSNEGESLGVQERQITGYAMQIGEPVARTFVERGVSGSVPFSDRPEGRELLAIVRPGDVIISPKLDRCFRSALDALDVLRTLQDRRVSLHLLDLGGDVVGNGISKLVFTILSAVAEAERDRIRERIATVKADQKKRGRYLGGIVPFGFEVDEHGFLRPLPEHTQTRATIFDMRAKGASLRAISAALKGQGVNLSHEGVNAVLKYPATS